MDGSKKGVREQFSLQTGSMVNKAADGVMCEFCPIHRPGQAVLPAEHGKKAGGKFQVQAAALQQEDVHEDVTHI